MITVPDSEILLDYKVHRWCRPGCTCDGYCEDWLYYVFGVFSAIYLLEMKKGIYIMDRIMNVYIKHDIYRIGHIIETATTYHCPLNRYGEPITMDIGSFMLYNDYFIRKIIKMASDDILEKLYGTVQKQRMGYISNENDIRFIISNDIINLIAKEQIYRRRRFCLL
jgi:hypothetical protein